MIATNFAKFLAIATEPAYLLILAIIISALLYLNKQKSQAILLVSVSIITTLAIKTLKNIFQIPRPVSGLILETGYSFPSGHTTFAVVFFGLMAYIFAKKEYKFSATIVSALIIIAIAWSRLHLQVHYLSDVIAGLAVGSTILFLSILIHKKYS